MSDRPRTPNEWATFYSSRRTQQESAKSKTVADHPLYHFGNPMWPKGPMHPLLLAPGHHRYEREAHEAIRAQREQAELERQWRYASHPQVVGELSAIPIPKPGRETSRR